jgi:exopolysaccharide production protein ExoQ
MMPSHVALLVWSVLLLILLRYASAKESTSSPALWIPVSWAVVMGSRSPAQWLGLVPTNAATAFEEGSPLDRAFYLVLIGLALWTLAKRQFSWRDAFARNAALTSFLLFALASVVWSDFPFISFKRWIRDLGMYLMVLVVLTDPRPVDAISIIIRRLSYVLLIFSVIFIKYYDYLGIMYDPWTGAPEYVGATTSKNMLGVLCLISGLFYFWDTVRRWSERRDRKSRRLLFVNLALMAMTLWLLRLSQSATSQGSLVIGCFIIAVVRSKWATVNPRRVTALIPGVVAVYLILEFAFDFSTVVADFFGRDATLHGRTGIWNAVLALQTNPIVGVGYQSFWLGDRLKAVWASLRTGFLNEAHNGYLEVYLNLGLVGLALLVVFMISIYRRACKQLRTSPHFASLTLGLWTAMVFYNVTEAALGASLLWYAILLCGIDIRPSHAVMPSGARPRIVPRQPTTVSGHSIIPTYHQ